MTTASSKPSQRPSADVTRSRSSAADVPLSLTERGETSTAGLETAISTQALFGSKREILLSHAGALYRLRITSKDKLILTK